MKMIVDPRNISDVEHFLDAVIKVMNGPARDYQKIEVKIYERDLLFRVDGPEYGEWYERYPENKQKS